MKNVRTREATTTTAAEPRHLPILDGLRGIAVLLVLWDHAPRALFPEWLREVGRLRNTGNFGVDLFFVLSGFLITRILLAGREAGVPVRYFLLRRACRIFPIYYLLLLALALVRPHQEIGWCALYLSNYYGVVSDLPPSWLHHTWSLCVEEHFYAGWPLVVSFLPRLWSRRVIVAVVIPAALLSGLALVLLPTFDGASAWLGARVAAGTIDPFDRLEFILYGTQCRVLSLAVGALFAYHEASLRTRARSWLVAAALALVAATGLSVGAPAIGALLQRTFAPSLPAHDWSVFTGFVATTFASSATLAAVLALSGRAWRPMALLEARPLRAIGRISYGLYLFHVPLFQALGIHRLAQQGATWKVVGIFAALFAVAIVSYHVIERPILRWGSRWRQPPTARSDARSQARLAPGASH